MKSYLLFKDFLTLLNLVKFPIGKMGFEQIKDKIWNKLYPFNLISLYQADFDRSKYIYLAKSQIFQFGLVDIARFFWKLFTNFSKM